MGVNYLLNHTILMDAFQILIIEVGSLKDSLKMDEINIT